MVLRQKKKRPSRIENTSTKGVVAGQKNLARYLMACCCLGYSIKICETAERPSKQATILKRLKGLLSRPVPPTKNWVLVFDWTKFKPWKKEQSHQSNNATRFRPTDEQVRYHIKIGERFDSQEIRRVDSRARQFLRVLHKITGVELQRSNWFDKDNALSFVLCVGLSLEIRSWSSAVIRTLIHLSSNINGGWFIRKPCSILCSKVIPFLKRTMRRRTRHSNSSFKRLIQTSRPMPAEWDKFYKWFARGFYSPQIHFCPRSKIRVS